MKYFLDASILFVFSRRSVARGSHPLILINILLRIKIKLLKSPLLLCENTRFLYTLDRTFDESGAYAFNLLAQMQTGRPDGTFKEQNLNPKEYNQGPLDGTFHYLYKRDFKIKAFSFDTQWLITGL